MNIKKFFEPKCMVQDDVKHDLTGFMQGLSSIEQLQQANAEKLARAKEILGTQWLLHPTNATKKVSL